METPTSNRSRRRSSLSKSRKSSIESSASKIVKTLILKDKLRKQNQYKTAKVKRAQLYERKRHIEDENHNNLNRNIKLEEEEEEAEEEEEEEHIFEEDKIDNQDKIMEMEEVKKIESNHGISSKLSSTIVRRINSLKNTIKNIVNNNSSKTNLNLNKENKSQQSHNSNEPIHKVRRSVSMSQFNNMTRTRPALMGLKKQESLSNCGYTNSIQCSTLLSSSSSSSKMTSYSSTTSLSSKNSSHNISNKPIFKISKIQYNDSYLYRKESVLTESDKNKYHKIITNRKVAHLGSTSSLDKFKI